jgi:hypothetical protein
MAEADFVEFKIQLVATFAPSGHAVGGKRNDQFAPIVVAQLKHLDASLETQGKTGTTRPRRSS